MDLGHVDVRGTPARESRIQILLAPVYVSTVGEGQLSGLF